MPGSAGRQEMQRMKSAKQLFGFGMVFLFALRASGDVPTEDVSDTVSIRVTDFGESHPWLLDEATNLRQAAARKSPESRGGLRTLDDAFVEVCELLPGFGGLYYDDTGRLNVYLLDPTRDADAKAAMQAVLGNQLVQRANRALRGTSGAAIDAVDQIDMTFLQGEFTFSQLKTWKGRISTLTESLENIVYLDADEKANRVTIGVEPGSRVDVIEDVLVKDGIPRRAVVIVESEPFVHLYTLHDALRPTFGGQRITMDNNEGGLNLCTLGFNAYHSQVGPGFATASHCSLMPISLDSGSYYQPLPDLYIGYEVVDPTYFEGGVCPSDRYCRYADANFVRYDPGTDVYAILGHTYYRGVTLIEDEPFFYVVNEIAYPMVGDELQKVGQTTGWTGGNCSLTCVNVYIGSTPSTFLCQDIVDDGGNQVADAGDSGAPVFMLEGGLNVSLVGVLSAGDVDGTVYSFSAMENIQYELGSLTTY
jgi:hypothetical protein